MTSCSKHKPQQKLDIDGDAKSDIILYECNLKEQSSTECLIESFNLKGENIGSEKVYSKNIIPVYGDFNSDKRIEYGTYEFTTSGNRWNLIAK